MRDLTGRLAIVTGASGGIGVFVAKALASKGMNIVLAARSESALENVAADIRRRVQQLPVHHGVAADEAIGVSGWTCADNAVDGVHDNKRLADDGKDLGGSRRQGRLVVFNVHQFALLLADPEREHAKDAERQAEQAGDDTDEHRIHGSSLCFRNA